MARPKNRRTKKRTAPVTAPVSAPVAETAAEAVKSEPAAKAEPEVKAEPVKAEAPKAAPAETKAAEVKETIKEAPAKAAESKTAPKKKPAAKPEKAAAPKKEDTFVFQSNDKEYTAEQIAELCKAAYRNGTRKQVKSCNVYLKTENGGLRAYYVINGNADGAYIDL